MPNLNAISLLINASLQAGHFKSQRFNPTRFNGLADPIRKVNKEGTETTTPTIITNKGEGDEVVFNDKYSAQCFHRLINTQYDIPDEPMGFPAREMKEIANMKMVFMGDRAKMKVRQEDVIAAVAFDFPKEFLPATVQSLELTSCVIEMGTVDSEPYEVFVQEWNGHNYSLTTSSILFAINYKITSTYAKCFTICS